MMKTEIPVAVLVRVSTTKQETDRQIAELSAVAASKGWNVIEVVQEQVSGSSKSRPGIVRIQELVKTGKLRKVLVHEVSRIARLNSTAHKFLEDLECAGVSLYWHAQAIETLLPNGKRNPAAGVMFALLAEMARSERETLIERTKSGLAEARRRGRTLGRPVGSGLDAKQLVAKHPDIARHLRAGLSIRKVAKLTDKSPPTVLAVKKAMQSKLSKP